MQLFFQQVGGGGGYVLLYDFSAIAAEFDKKVQAPAAWPVINPRFTGAVQRDQLFTVPDPSGNTVVSPFRQPLSNVSCTMKVVLHSIYKTADDCLASMRTFVQLLQMKVHFKIVQGNETQFYPNAVVTDYSPIIENIAATHEFTFESDTVTANAP